MATKFAQKFTTTFISDGCRVHLLQDCPIIGMDGAIPTHIRLQVFTWNSSYTTTIAGTAHVTEDAVVPSEAIEDDEMWFYMMWKPLAAGTYLWLLTVQTDASDDTGTFQVVYDPTSIKFDSYEDASNTPLGGDFESEVFELNSGDYESALSLGDVFGAHETDGGHSGTKINRGSTGTPSYANSIEVQDAVSDGTRKTGRIGSGSLVKVN